MRYLGINCLNHDAAMAVVDDNEILWAAHSERYSQIKNDQFLNWEIVNEANRFKPFDCVVYYEKPLLKKTRQLFARQYKWFLDYRELPSVYLRQFNIKIDAYSSHHQSHAAGGFYTSPWDDAEILTIDSIGEWDSITIFDNMKLKYRRRYPYSLGLLYSAITARIGLKPNEDEYITMGMAAYGKPIYKKEIIDRLEKNNHKGVGNLCPSAKYEDLAASVQLIYEEELLKLVALTKKENLIISGGCALNCVANSLIKNKNIWIMPNPGDSGSALGSIANINKKKLNWKGPYLGTNIRGSYPIDYILKELETNKIVGVANGKSEYGPRALGNRSLLADPRGSEIKDTVNGIKKRQKFRPFAPMILEEDVHDFFEMPVPKSPYMQFVGKCKFPSEYPAIVHFDGTSRVQTVSKRDHEGVYYLLKEWKSKTGCPMLLNTSLNIKGKPMVNNKNHAKEFERKYHVKVV